jgi:hypothetical protein
MKEDIFICLHANQWKTLEPYLPAGTVKTVLKNAGHLPLLDYRTGSEDAAYQTNLDAARAHCSEMDKHLSLDEAFRRIH